MTTATNGDRKIGSLVDKPIDRVGEGGVFVVFLSCFLNFYLFHFDSYFLDWFGIVLFLHTFLSFLIFIYLFIIIIIFDTWPLCFFVMNTIIACVFSITPWHAPMCGECDNCLVAYTCAFLPLCKDYVTSAERYEFPFALPKVLKCLKV